MNKKELCSILDETLIIAKNNKIDNEALLSKFETTKNDLKNFTAKILVVGAFSAGKSAMLNAFLGNEEILPESIAPETAIATEIRYGTDEKVQRITQKGSIINSSFADVKDSIADGYSKYIYILDRPQLRDLQLQDLIIVDMPGFNSGIAAHNRAIMQNIGEAAAYVFVIDMNKGTIEQSSLNFLTEIKQYSDSVFFVLTKSDKVSPSNINSIHSEIKTTLTNILGTEPPIMVMSAREEEAGSKLAGLFRQFSADTLLQQKYGGQIIILLQQVIAILKTQSDALDFNSKDFDLAILKRENNKKDILAKLRKEKQRLLTEMQFSAPEKILREAEIALSNQLTSLVDSYMLGDEAFHKTINCILRPLLIQATENQIEVAFNDYQTKITAPSDSQPIDAINVTDQIKNTYAAVEKIARMGKEFAENRLGKETAENRTGKEAAENNYYQKLYKIFSTSLAVTTDVVCPWLELIIIFLPDIINVINSYRENSRIEQLKEQMARIVIPQICDQLRPDVQRALHQLAQEQADQLEEQIKITLESEDQALNNLKIAKEEQDFNVKQKRDTLSHDIASIYTMIVRIANNANEY